MSISRRKFSRASAGAASAGLLMDSALSKPLLAAAEAHRACPVQPEPIPHTIATPFGTTIHFFFPGPVEGVDANTGHDPSVITNFKGIIGQADLLLHRRERSVWLPHRHAFHGRPVHRRRRCNT
jgi:hypothetical protein